MTTTSLTHRPFTSALGVHGWTRLDQLLLAALALEAPLLLIGPHGTAKTLLAERMATALAADFRHYNASLLNYDDLVGIPMPDDHGGLRFVGTRGAVWGATFVFFDEVNRCRADLQNKLFPIVHERRLAGVELEQLQHRWAAMNPPGLTDDLTGYLGVEPLDAALADRFWFAVRVPSWESLSREQRTALVAGVRDDDEIDVAGLVRETRDRLASTQAEHGPFALRYAVTLVDSLADAGVAISPRRAALLHRAVVATVAAAQVLGRDPSFSDAAELVVLNGLPQWADPEPPSPGAVLAAHAQALALAEAQGDDIARAVLEERDPARRVRTALDLGATQETLATATIGALSSQPTNAHRAALSALLAHALAEQPLTPAAWSAVARHGVRVTRPGERTLQVAPGRRLESWRAASAWKVDHTDDSSLGRFLQAVVEGCGPELLEGVDAVELGRAVESWAGLFGVPE